jgi:hypothetical protein
MEHISRGRHGPCVHIALVIPPSPPRLQVDLHSVYRGVAPGEHVYHLRSMVCYYGAHYFAFVLLPEQQAWVQIDDTRASRVGSWADVRRKCELGRVQPSMLFYEAQS